MPFHTMGPLIKLAFEMPRPAEIKQFAGLEVFLNDGDAEPIFKEVYTYVGVLHSEQMLFNYLGETGELNNNPVKVHLYSYFAPCPFCTDYLAPYPGKYPQTKFYLAYSGTSGTGISYMGAGKSEDNLQRLHKSGWKVRHWYPLSNGRVLKENKKRYEEQGHRIPGKDTYEFEAIKREVSYPAGTRVPLLLPAHTHLDDASTST